MDVLVGCCSRELDFGPAFSIRRSGDQFVRDCDKTLASVCQVTEAAGREWAEAEGETFDIRGCIFYGVSLVLFVYGASLLPKVYAAGLVIAGIIGMIIF